MNILRATQIDLEFVPLSCPIDTAIVHYLTSLMWNRYCNYRLNGLLASNLVYSDSFSMCTWRILSDYLLVYWLMGGFIYYLLSSIMHNALGTWQRCLLKSRSWHIAALFTHTIKSKPLAWHTTPFLTWTWCLLPASWLLCLIISLVFCTQLCSMEAVERTLK